VHPTKPIQSNPAGSVHKVHQLRCIALWSSVELSGVECLKMHRVCSGVDSRP